MNEQADHRQPSGKLAVEQLDRHPGCCANTESGGDVATDARRLNLNQAESAQATATPTPTYSLVAVVAAEALAAFAGVALSVRLARIGPAHSWGLVALGGLFAAAGLVALGVGVWRRWHRVHSVTAAVQVVLLALATVAMIQQPALGLCGLPPVLGLVLLVHSRPGRHDTAESIPSELTAPAPPVPLSAMAVESAGSKDRHSGPPGPRTSVAGALLAVATTAVILGALTVHSQIVYGMAVLAIIFIPIEKLFALHPRRVLRRGWRTDLVHYLVNGVLLNAGVIAAVIVAGSVLRAAVPAALREGVASQPLWAQLVEGFLIAGLGGYAGHRAAHEVPLLWRFHKVHHSIQEMDWLAANHLHPLDEVFIRSCAVVPLYALGYGQASLGGFAVLTTFQAIFIHSNVRLTFGPLRWLIATPQFHHWHHANEPAAYNTNYAGEFPLLDWLFGTLYMPAGQWPTRYGIDQDQPDGYLRQLAWPFRRNASTTA